MYKIINNDCMAGMATFPDNHFHSCITDPPYGLKFMGAHWDHGVPDKTYWQEVSRVLRPGGYLLAFGGTRTFHRLMVEIEDAGFEIRDTIMWVYGSGFPKGNNLGKSTGKPEWDGWNTNLKPAWEPIIVARKPVEGTVAENVMKYQTGGINIDGCRVDGEPSPSIGRRESSRKAGVICPNLSDTCSSVEYYNHPKNFAEHKPSEELGRYPANLIHDGSEEVLEHFPITNTKPNATTRPNHYVNPFGSPRTMQTSNTPPIPSREYADCGSAARFFYCAKASKKDRDEGCPNTHPTVKPTNLMQYLCKLVTPKGGIILDPFCGSGSTGKAALLEGCSFVGIEKEEQFAKIAELRCKHVEDRTCPTENYL